MSESKYKNKNIQDGIKDSADKAPKLFMGQYEMKFEPDDLDDFFQKRAFNELRETPENIEEGLRILKELIKGEPDLKVPLDDDFLKRFLRPCKWYPKSAFELMKRFYKYRATHSRYCENLKPSNEKIALLSNVLRPLPLRTSEGARIVLIEGGKKWKPKELSLDQLFRGVILFLEAVVAEPKSQVSGARVLLDMDGLSLSQVTYFTPSFAAAVVEFVQRCLPCRLKGIHIINQPFIFNMVFAIFKPFLHQKLRERIHFHGKDKESLMKFIDSKALPKRYGGDADIPDEPLGDALYNYFCAFEDDFIESSQLGYPFKK